ncbi:MAG: SCO family protein [Verrucomicrobiota bacterium]
MKTSLLVALVVSLGAAWAEETRDFTVRGVVREAVPAKSQLVVKHEEIPGYMDAMTMPFQVRDPKILESVKAGDDITFQLHVTDKDHWIDGLKIVGAGDKEPPRPKATDIAPLKPGDPLPALTFSDEKGQPLRLEDYRGKALALTFIYTRCPLPNFCPLLSQKFHTVQETLLADPAAPKNWQLLSVSIDPEHDTAEVLQRYAKAQQADAAHWRFATGELRDITVLGLRSGLEFWEGGSEITHNLRTVIFDAQGRMRKVFSENTWTEKEIADELRAGALLEK